MLAAVPRLFRSPRHTGAGATLRTGLAAVFLLGAGSAPILSWPALAQDHPANHANNHLVHHPTHHTEHEPARAGSGAAHPTIHPATHAHAALTRHAPHRGPVAAAPAPVVKTVQPPPPVAPVPVVPPAPPKGSATGLPLPRFASLRADAVNLRGGPGTRYPIQWVYKRRDLPVRIEREFDVWRLVEDSDGVKGWVHQATLVGTRTFVIPGAASASAQTDAAAPAATETTATGTEAAGQARNLGSSSAPTVAGRLDAATGVIPPGAIALRASPQPDGNLVAVLMPGIVGRIRSCSPGSGWCKVSVRDYSGWLPRDAFWGLLPDETILPP